MCSTVQPAQRRGAVRNLRLSLSLLALLAAGAVAAQDAPAAGGAAAPAAAPAAPVNGDALTGTLVALIQTLVDQGVLSAGKAQEMLRQAGIDPSLLSSAAKPPLSPVAPAPEPPVVRVPYVPQTLKDELREELSKDVLARAHDEKWTEPGAYPSWIDRLRFYGDVRFRVEREDYSSANASPAAIDDYYQLPLGTTLTTTDSRNRPRLRARLGVDATIDEHFSANLMFLTTTGDDATASPVSFNSDQGRYDRPFSAGVDVAYLQWAPTPSWHLTGGRMSNPYLSSDMPFLASDLVWWPDISFDGVLVNYAPHWTPAWSGFVNAGAHPLQTNQLGPYNEAQQQWMYAGQAGVAYRAADQSTARLLTSYFSYVGIQGTLNPLIDGSTGSTLYSDSAPLFRQRGNTMFNINYLSNPGTPLWAYAGRFKEFELDGNFEWARFDPLRLGVDIDWVRNLGFNAAESFNQVGVAIASLPADRSGSNGLQRPRVNAYRLGLMAGRHALERLGDWQVFGGYRYLQRDSVVDAFTSPDYHLGGTDQKGFFLGTNVGLGTRSSVILRYSATRPIDAVPGFEINEWFLDFLGRF
jgi:hypothetical protein